MNPDQSIHVKNCFGCDPDNPIGLKAVFTPKENTLTGYFQTTENHQGPPGFVHGGIISAFIDEACSYYTRKFIGTNMLTFRNVIQFKNPVRLGDVLSIEVNLKEERNRTIILSSSVYANETIKAVGESHILKIKEKGQF